MKYFLCRFLRTAFLFNVISNSVYSFGQQMSEKHSKMQEKDANDILKSVIMESKIEIATENATDRVVYSVSPIVTDTFENVTFWAEVEEEIFKLVKVRLKKLHEEIRILNASLSQYPTIAGMNKFNSLQTSETRNKCLILELLQIIRSFMNLSLYLHDLFFIEVPLHYVRHQTEYTKNDVGLMTTAFPGWPSLIDLKLSMDSLIYIQEVHIFNYKELPAALSPETTKPPQLNAFHCNQIGLHALYRENYVVAIELLEHGVTKVTKYNDSSIPLLQLESSLELAIEMHNQNLSEVNSSKSLTPLNLFEDFVTFNKLPSFKRKVRYNPRYKAEGNLDHAESAAEYNFNAICSGKDFRTIRERSSLFCWYDKSSSPARTILPYKKELLSFEPELVQIHDFIGDKLISVLLKNKIQCNISTETLTQMQRPNTASICISQFPELEFFLKKISTLTHTDLQANWSYAPANLHFYLPGQRLRVHIDTMLEADDDANRQYKVAYHWDNLLSMLFYFNDVPAGGFTAFPNAGTFSQPVKGSVVLWRNMHRNGSMRIDTWHGACPVIYGRKQVLVVGIHSQAQFLTYPCTLNQTE